MKRITAIEHLAIAKYPRCAVICLDSSDLQRLRDHLGTQLQGEAGCKWPKIDFRTSGSRIFQITASVK